MCDVLGYFCLRLHTSIESSDVVIVGGKFIWPAEEAREEMDRIGRVKGVVTADYTTTTDRQDLGESGMIDYIVCWPKDSIQQIKANVECGEYRRAVYSPHCQVSGESGRSYDCYGGSESVRPAPARRCSALC